MDVSLTEIALLMAAAFTASTMAAVTGTGGGIILLPVLIALIGVRDAVPAYTLAQFIGNLSRVLFNRKDVRLDVVAWFAAGAVPAAVLGAMLFARSQETILVRLLGAFLLASVAWRRLNPRPSEGFPAHRFAGIGGVFGVVSAYLGSAGPFLAPFFLSFGLVRGAYIGTEALGTAIMHITKMCTYGASGVFSRQAVLAGLTISPVMVAGSFAGKRIIDRISRRVFVAIIETILVVFGILFLGRG